MSIQQIARTMRSRFQSPAHAHVALVLADHASEDGRDIYPTVERVALMSHRSVRQVQRIMADLREIGWLRECPGAKNGARCYRINQAAVPLRSEFSDFKSKKPTEPVPEARSAPRGDTHDTPVTHDTPGGDTHDTLKIKGGDTHDTPGVTPMTPKPSVNRNEYKSSTTVVQWEPGPVVGGGSETPEKTNEQSPAPPSPSFSQSPDVIEGPPSQDEILRGLRGSSWAQDSDRAMFRLQRLYPDIHGALAKFQAALGKLPDQSRGAQALELLEALEGQAISREKLAEGLRDVIARLGTIKHPWAWLRSYIRGQRPARAPAAGASLADDLIAQMRAEVEAGHVN